MPSGDLRNQMTSRWKLLLFQRDGRVNHEPWWAQVSSLLLPLHRIQRTGLSLLSNFHSFWVLIVTSPSKRTIPPLVPVVCRSAEFEYDVPRLRLLMTESFVRNSLRKQSIYRRKPCLTNSEQLELWTLLSARGQDFKWLFFFQLPLDFLEDRFSI